MEITEVRVALREPTARPPGQTVERAGAAGAPERTGEGGETRLKAYATLTFDNCFVVRNVKIIEGKSGLFVAMPSHKPKVACGRCQFKNDFGGRYCCQCGSALSRPAPSGEHESGGGTETPTPAQAHRDIAHPITVEFRQYLQQKVLAAYEAERAKAQGSSGVCASETGE